MKCLLKYLKISVCLSDPLQIYLHVLQLFMLFHKMKGGQVNPHTFFLVGVTHLRHDLLIFLSWKCKQDYYLVLRLKVWSWMALGWPLNIWGSEVRTLRRSHLTEYHLSTSHMCETELDYCHSWVGVAHVYMSLSCPSCDLQARNMTDYPFKTIAREELNNHTTRSWLVPERHFS